MHRHRTRDLVAMTSREHDSKRIAKQSVCAFGLECPVVRDPKRSVGNILDWGVRHAVFFCSTLVVYGAVI